VSVRRFALFLVVGAVMAGSTAGVSSAGGGTYTSVIGPVPPTNVNLPAVCQIHFDPNTELFCTATAPNPEPPKDTKVYKFTDLLGGSCKLTAYPGGGVTEACRYKKVLEG